ncbi:MarR family winged helix-turn-helix transcriptional regulator [Paenibacillus sp. YN15]|uniref:MarR family winged helix-turn-helix transcriptional regulator n=1 Tax=Paenibacillus sp. YN15 TaxID=1742774 RepID=UPI000DCCE029|nr:MarR family transcriptional regulator [Paenibacillus sp. YN15]RAU97147.1 MarR family transcriptional regulator [Paenibacillus sp. YN15]
MPPLREGGFLISMVKQLSGRIFDRLLKKAGIEDLNNAQGRIMFALWKEDRIPIRRLAQATALGKTTLSSMLERMEQAGHIERTADPADKRSTLVALSDSSKNMMEQYRQVSGDMLALFYDGLAEEEIDRFEATLRHILANLTRYEEENK